MRSDVVRRRLLQKGIVFGLKGVLVSGYCYRKRAMIWKGVSDEMF